MIWQLLYMCFLDEPLNTEKSNVYIYTIENGTSKDAKRVVENYCL